MINIGSFDKSFTIKNIKLKNRIVMPPMSRNLSPKHLPNAAVAAYYQRRAQGGVGLIITEASAIDHPAAQGARAHAQGAIAAPGFNAAALPGWKSVVKAVKQFDTAIFAQLWHVGSTREPEQSFNPEVGTYGPSAVIHPRFTDNGPLPIAMTEEDIADHIAAYVRSANYAKAASFDGVEIHAAHGYGLDQFFWEATNFRTDKYGGKQLAQRTRFAVEIIKAVKAALGQQMPVSLRISQWKMGDYTHKMAQAADELEQFLYPLASAGVDIFHVSTQKFYQPAFDDSDLTLAEWVKKITGTPVIAVGSIGLNTDLMTSLGQGQPATFDLEHLELAAKMLENESIDLIAIGRALIADPDWLIKVREGRYQEIIGFEKDQLNRL